MRKLHFCVVLAVQIFKRNCLVMLDINTSCEILLESTFVRSPAMFSSANTHPSPNRVARRVNHEYFTKMQDPKRRIIINKNDT